MRESRRTERGRGGSRGIKSGESEPVDVFRGTREWRVDLRGIRQEVCRRPYKVLVFRLGFLGEDFWKITEG